METGYAPGVKLGCDGFQSWVAEAEEIPERHSPEVRHDLGIRNLTQRARGITV
jgi:hypothetical protein